MQTKICVKCNIEKPINEFLFRKDTKKYRNECRSCQTKYHKEYRKLNNESLKLKWAEYRKNNKEKISKYHSNWNKKHKNLKDDIYIRHKEYAKKYRQENGEKIKIYRKKSNKNYREKHKEEIRKIHRNWDKRKRKNDAIYVFKCKTRVMIIDSFKRKGIKKQYKCETILGCKLDFFVSYLLQTYKDNYGYEWDGIESVHIDHKMPLSTATTEEEVIKLCHYSNLQLLKAKDNLEKSDKLNWKLNRQV